MLHVPLPNPLVEQLAMRLGRQKTATKSLVIPLAGERAIVKRGKQAIREADARKGIDRCAR